MSAALDNIELSNSPPEDKHQHCKIDQLLAEIPHLQPGQSAPTMGSRSGPGPLAELDPNANNSTPAKKQSKSKRQATSNPSKEKDTTKASSLSHIHLDGEENESAPIYATCNDMRRDINKHLSSTTKAAFARELTELLPRSKVTTRNLDQLLRMRGPCDAAHNIAFYAAYVFFEKIRIRDGKKKSAKREKMEEIHGPKGLERKGQHNKFITCMDGERPFIDQYGQWQIR